MIAIQYVELGHKDPFHIDTDTNFVPPTGAVMFILDTNYIIGTHYFGLYTEEVSALNMRSQVVVRIEVVKVENRA
jgi:hypothetical protein